MSQLIEEPKPSSYTVDPYSARAFILNLEKDYNLTIRVHESGKYCTICIDKEMKDEEGQKYDAGL